jgi:hypothetical protein
MSGKRRYSLRGRIGQRYGHPKAGLPRRVAAAIGVYVASSVLGWATMGVLIALVMR